MLGVGLATQTEATDGVGPHGTKVIKPPPAPDEIAKHFPQLEILECLGRGGMGVVYKARQPKLNRIVALKILAPEKEAEPKFAERFLREAQTLARLNHPNIVTVHDFGETDGLCYLLMEFVDGLTLRQMMREGRMKPEEALAIVPRICEALQFAHEQGIVHRDIKPENVLLDKQGRVKIADFGIAKLMGGAPLPVGEGPGVPKPGERVGLTQDQVLGTPHYMAPEQVEHPQTVDHRADIYSLGVVFYEMLTGELPLGKFQPPSKKVQVDVRLDEVVLHALEKEPARRYQQASQVKTDVETISAGAKSAFRIPNSEIASHFSRTAIVGACCLALTVLAGAGALLVSSQSIVLALQTPVLPRPLPQQFLDQGRTIFLIAILSQLFGTICALAGTTLGWIAVSQIRRSAGRLYGMWLAVFDGLLFPLLALDGFILFVGTGLTSFARSWIHQQGMHESVLNTLAPLLLVLLMYGGIAIADYWIIRRVWRAVNKPLPNLVAGGRGQLAQTETKSSQRNQGQDRFWRRFAVVAALVLLAMLLIPAGALFLWVATPNLIKSPQPAQAIAADSRPVVRVEDEPPPMAAMLAANFGPVREVTLNDIDELRGAEALDLDSGKLLDLPKDLEKRTEPARLQWLKDQSADMLLDNVGGRWGLMTIADNELKLAPLPNNSWDASSDSSLSNALAGPPGGMKADPQRVWRIYADDRWQMVRERDLTFPLPPALDFIQHGDWQVYVLATNAEPPLTFALRTASGASGLLQITGFTGQPKSARLRYKLVQPPSDSTGSRNPEGSQRKFVRLVVDKAALTFEGQPTTWDGVDALLEKVPERKNTVLECAVTSDQITVQQQNEWFGKCVALAHNLGFEYASFIGIHPLGSKGTTPSK